MKLRSPRLRKKAAVRSPEKEINAAQRLYAKEAKKDLRRKPNREKEDLHKRQRRRTLVIAAAAVMAILLCAVPVTYSYLTASSKTVVNTFAGGAISLTLDEAKVDTDGNLLEDEPRVQENTYKIVPGATLYKDPTVTVLEGSEECYVFLYVEDPLSLGDYSDYFSINYSDGWIKIATTGTKTLYVYKTTVDASDEEVVLTPIFTTITVSDELTSEQIKAMGEVQIKVQAYAIQVQGVDSATSIQMAAAYFADEFEVEFTDINTTVEIEGAYTEETAAADTTSDTTGANSSSDAADTSDEESEGTDASDTKTDSTSSDTTDTGSDSASSGDAEADSTDTSDSDTGSDVSTQSTDDMDDTAGLNITE